MSILEFNFVQPMNGLLKYSICLFLISFFAEFQAWSQNAEELSLLLRVDEPHRTYYDQDKGNNDHWMGGKNEVLAVASVPLSGLMLFYQKVLSPQLSTSCQFAVSCSNFSKQAFQEYGIIKGMGLTLDRLYRCNGATHKFYGRPFRDKEGLLEESVCEHY